MLFRSLLAAGAAAGSLVSHLWALTSCGGAVLVARGLLRLASPADYVSAEVFSGSVYASPLVAPLLSSPFDFLASGLTALALVLGALVALESVRVGRVLRRREISTWRMAIAFTAMQLFAGVAVLFVFRMQRSLIDDTVANTALDLSQFSLHPWSTARLALQLGFVGWHVSALGLALLAIRLARLPWRLTGDEVGARLTMVLAWVDRKSTRLNSSHT